MSGEVVAPTAAALAAVLPIGICLVGDDGRIGYANPAFAEILGAPPGRWPRWCPHPQTRSPIKPCKGWAATCSGSRT